MKSFAQILKEKRTEYGLKLKDISKALEIDVAIVSKLERGDRKATKKQALDFIKLYSLDKKQVLTQWLSERILAEIAEEEFALDALYLAEETYKNIVADKDKPNIDAYLSALLKKIDLLNEKRLEKQKLYSKDKIKVLNTKNIIEYVFESNRISGNSFSLEETSLIINNDETISGKTMNEHLEVLNHYDAVEYIEDLINNKTKFSEEVLKEIHYQLFKGIDRKNAGKYRQINIEIKANKYTPPKPELINKKIEELLQFIGKNNTDIHTIIFVAELHKKIYYLSPFAQGNDKIARLVMNLFLQENKYSWIHFLGDKKSKNSYYKILEKVQLKKEYKNYYVFVCERILERFDL